MHKDPSYILFDHIVSLILFMKNMPMKHDTTTYQVPHNIICYVKSFFFKVYIYNYSQFLFSHSQNNKFILTGMRTICDQI